MPSHSFDMSSLPAYSGPNVECIKCGNQTANTSWQPSTNVLRTDMNIWTESGSDDPQPGWLLRECSRCQYQWPEQVIAAQVEPVEEPVEPAAEEPTVEDEPAAEEPADEDPSGEVTVEPADEPAAEPDPNA